MHFDLNEQPNTQTNHDDDIPKVVSFHGKKKFQILFLEKYILKKIYKHIENGAEK